MIAWYNLLWICPCSFFAGFILCAMIASTDKDERDRDG